MGELRPLDAKPIDLEFNTYNKVHLSSFSYIQGLLSKSNNIQEDLVAF